MSSEAPKKRGRPKKAESGVKAVAGTRSAENAAAAKSKEIVNASKTAPEWKLDMLDTKSNNVQSAIKSSSVSNTINTGSSTIMASTAGPLATKIIHDLQKTQNLGNRLLHQSISENPAIHSSLYPSLSHKSSPKSSTHRLAAMSTKSKPPPVTSSSPTKSKYKASQTTTTANKTTKTITTAKAPTSSRTPPSFSKTTNIAKPVAASSPSSPPKPYVPPTRPAATTSSQPASSPPRAIAAAAAAANSAAANLRNLNRLAVDSNTHPLKTIHRPESAPQPFTQKQYRGAARRWTALMVSLPLFLVSSWWVYERVVMGKEQRRVSPPPQTQLVAAEETSQGSVGASSRE